VIVNDEGIPEGKSDDKVDGNAVCIMEGAIETIRGSKVEFELMLVGILVVVRTVEGLIDE
jgi:hypothetical protein